MGFSRVRREEVIFDIAEWEWDFRNRRMHVSRSPCLHSSNHLERCVRHGRMIPLEPSFL